jgi:hypothetical protein
MFHFQSISGSRFCQAAPEFNIAIKCFGCKIGMMESFKISLFHYIPKCYIKHYHITIIVISNSNLVIDLEIFRL